MSQRPGREIPKEYRDIVNYQLDRHGWRYDPAKRRGGHPALYPTDSAQRPIPVPTTPKRGHSRAWDNFIGQVRRAGGTWPPEEE